MSWQFVVLQRTQFTMLSTIMKYFFSHSKFTLPLHLLENIPISKTLTLSFNNQQKFQSPNFLINLSKLYIWQLQRTYISAQALQSSLLLAWWSADYSHHHLLDNRSTSHLFMYNLCANPRIFPRYGHMVQWPNSSPPALDWWMVCDREWAEQEEAELGVMQYFERSWFEQSQDRSLLGSITQVVTFTSLDFYQKPFYENVRMPHHIAAFTSSLLSLLLPLSQKLKLQTVLRRLWIHL